LSPNADVLAAYRRHRDPVRLEAEMARLDEAEESSRSGAEDEALDPVEAVDFLCHLPALWEEAPSSRCALAESPFESVDVLGLGTMHVEPTPAAVPECRIVVPSWIVESLELVRLGKASE
jgi:hypothetical protein